MIIIEDLTVSYDGCHQVLDRVSLELTGPGIVGLIGPNGAGKSSLIKALLGLVPFQGTIRVAGQTGSAIYQKVAYVAQKSQIDVSFPMTVRECVSLGFYQELGAFGRLSQAHWDRVSEVLDQLGLTALAKRPISALSGGQFQRMLLARCLVQEAEVLLLDEPFVGIDRVSEDLIIQLLRDLRAAGKLILVVHHDLNTVRDYFDQLVILNRQLVAAGAVDHVFTPEKLGAAYGEVLVLGREVAHA